MTKLKRIAGIETTTFCNRQCIWCANRLLRTRDMEQDIFDQSLEVLEMFSPDVIAMNGCGEPFMDPDIVDRVDSVARLGYSPVIYTNGDFADEFILEDLKSAGLKKIFFSQHNDINEKIELAKRCGLDADTAYSPAVGGRTHTWAGQISTENTLVNKCSPLEKGWGYINVDGYVCQCCIDYDAKYPLGHVSFKERLVDITCYKIPLCESCTGSP